jgi:D-methionine transport system ATP-binding protein
LIEIKNLTKSYNGVEVLKGINLTIEKGDIYGLVGLSGAGKSTLLRCINGLEHFDSGSILVDGVEIKFLNNEQMRIFRKKMGMIFQQFSILSKKTVFSNIALPMECWGYGRSHIKERVEYLVKLVNLQDKIYARPNTLSGGQKQRVAIARALAMEPEYILSDEATSALDPNTSNSVIELLQDINRKLGITIIAVTHEMRVVQSLCNNISILENGTIAESGTVENVFLEKPESLKNLMGEDELNIPSSGVTLNISFSGGTTSRSVITDFVKSLSHDMNILSGNISQYNHKKTGSLMICIDQRDYSAAAAFLNQNDVIYTKLSRQEMNYEF